MDVDLLRRERAAELARKNARRLVHLERFASLKVAWDFDIFPPAVPLE